MYSSLTDSIKSLALDPVVNFGKVTVSTGYDNIATTIVLSSGEGSKLPDPSIQGSFNLVWYNSSDYPDPSDDPNVEIIRCITRVADTIVIMRTQEETTASNKNTPGKIYKMILAPTKKMFTDISTDTQSKIDIHAALTSTHGILGNIVGTTDIQTLTNKTISGDNNTLQNIDFETSIKQSTFQNQSFQNLLKNGNFEFWNAGISSAPDLWEYYQTGTGGAVNRESTDIKTGTYSTKITKSSSGVSEIYYVNPLPVSYMMGRTFTLGVWIKSANTIPNAVYVSINDLVTGAWDYSFGYYGNSGNWEFIAVTRTIRSPSVTQVNIQLMIESTANAIAYFDGAILVEGSIIPAFTPHPADVANPWYWRERSLVSNSSDIFIPNNTETFITFNYDNYDVGNMHDIAINNTRLTIPSTGIYLIIGHIRYRGPFTASRIYADIRRNGTEIMERVETHATGEIPRFEISALRSLNAGDYIELLVYQNSGTTQTMANEVNFAAMRMT